MAKPGNQIDRILNHVQNWIVWRVELAPDELVCQYFPGIWSNLQGLGLMDQLNNNMDLDIFLPNHIHCPLQWSPSLLVSEDQE